MSDLYDVPSHLESTKLTDRIEANWFDEMKSSPDNPSLIRVTLRTMGWKPLLIGLPLILMVTIECIILLSFLKFASHCVVLFNH